MIRGQGTIKLYVVYNVLEVRKDTIADAVQPLNFCVNHICDKNINVFIVQTSSESISLFVFSAGPIIMFLYIDLVGFVPALSFQFYQSLRLGVQNIICNFLISLILYADI